MKQILFISDDVDLQDTVAQQMGEAVALSFVPTHEGALRTIEDASYDALVVDATVSLRPGLAALKCVRQMARHRHTPAVTYSKGPVLDTLTGYEAVDAHLTTEDSLDQVRATLAAVDPLRGVEPGHPLRELWPELVGRS